MKKVISLLLAVITVFSLASCSTSNSHTVITVGDAEIPTDVFTYFLSDVLKDSPDITDKTALSEAGILKAAEYVAVNTMFKESELSLSTAQKEEIASDVDGLWHTYSDYYKSIGVTKSVLTKIRTSEAYRKMLLTHYYDTDGEFEIEEKAIKDYFYSNYIAFKSINGYLTETAEDGSTVKLSDDAIEKIKSEFAQMAKDIKRGADINEVNKDYATSHGYETTSVETTIYKKDGAFFPKNFFESASALKYNTPGVIFSDEYIFLVILTDMSKNENNYYQAYRNQCLTELASEDFQGKISAWVDEHKIKSVNNVIDNCCNVVLEKI